MVKTKIRSIFGPDHSDVADFTGDVCCRRRFRGIEHLLARGKTMSLEEEMEELESAEDFLQYFELDYRCQRGACQSVAHFTAFSRLPGSRHGTYAGR